MPNQEKNFKLRHWERIEKKSELNRVISLNADIIRLPCIHHNSSTRCSLYCAGATYSHTKPKRIGFTFYNRLSGSLRSLQPNVDGNSSLTLDLHLTHPNQKYIRQIHSPHTYIPSIRSRLTAAQINTYTLERGMERTHGRRPSKLHFSFRIDIVGRRSLLTPLAYISPASKI